MTPLLNLENMLHATLLLICTCTYLRSIVPSMLDRHKTGWCGTFWKMARIGERCSQFVSLACILMAIKILLDDK